MFVSIWDECDDNSQYRQAGRQASCYRSELKGNKISFGCREKKLKITLFYSW